MRASSRLPRILTLATILLLAFCLRIYKLDAQSLWYDEAVTARLATFNLTDLMNWTANDIQPPFYYIVIAGWTRVFGNSEWSLRFPSVAFSLLCISLIYVLARRLWKPETKSSNHVLPKLQPEFAALFAAVFPLWIFYAQEARNYTLLTVLSTLLAYIFYRLLTTQNRKKWWIAFIFVSTLGLYTHYFFAFLLIAFGVFFVFASLFRLLPCKAPFRKFFAEFVFSAFGIIVFYLPWLPFLLLRLRVDSSYWEGQLKINEFLGHLAINFTNASPEMMLESTAVNHLFLWGALLIAACLTWILVILYARHTKVYLLSFLFLLFSLLLPVAAVLLLSTQAPKFNPRYLMFTTPFFLLLFSSLPVLSIGPFSVRTVTFRRLITIISTFCLVVLPIFPINNWFFDPSFLKADWRGVADFVRAHRQPDEAVILLSGHANPAWNYYDPDILPIRLPAIDVLDVNQVLNYGVGDTLAKELSGKKGVWLVLWQDNVVDPVGFVHDFLQREGTELSASRQFSQINLMHFSLPLAAKFSSSPPISHFVLTNFANQVELMGWSQPKIEQRDAAPTLRLEWKALRPLTTTLKFAGDIFDAEGHLWGHVDDQRLATYAYPTTRWAPNQPVFSLVRLNFWQGTPPGRYNIRLRVYDEESGFPLSVIDQLGAPQGNTTRLGSFRLHDLVVNDQTEISFSTPNTVFQLIDTEPLKMTESWLGTDKIEPGMRVTFASQWQRTGKVNTNELKLELVWTAPNSSNSFTTTAVSLTPDFPVSNWPLTTTVLSQITTRVPKQVTPREWVLTLRLVDNLNHVIQTVGKTPIRVVKTDRQFELPAFSLPISVDFGESIRLVGGDVETIQQDPPSISVTLILQALSSPSTNWTATVQAVDERGVVLAQDDHSLGQRPTTEWLPGEVVTSTFRLTLPAGTPIDDVKLLTALYDSSSAGLPRLHTNEGAESVSLGTWPQLR